MISQESNKILSSFAIWVDHQIVSHGRAFNNYSGRFYPQTNEYSNIYSYGVPFSQFIYDNSISGANIGTGIYVNNIFLTTGQSGFLGYDFNKGIANFTTNYNNSTISGYYTIKEFNIELNTDSEETILFKTKYQLKNKYPQSITGISKDVVTYPIIYIKGSPEGENIPYSFGGTDQANYDIRCVILADSLFNLNSVQGILRNSVRMPVALLEMAEMPLNAIGSLKSGVFNYTGIAARKINSQHFAFIDRVIVPGSNQRLSVSQSQLNPDIHFNFIDFTLSTVGDYRNC